MAFRYAVFPDCKQFGAVATTSHSVSIVKLRNGVEFRTSRTDGALRSYEFVYGPGSNYSEIAQVNAFQLTMGGAEDSFLIRDFIDSNSSVSGIGAITPSDQVIASGNGSKRDFQLIKSYLTRDPAGALVAFKIREIEHPKALTTRIALDGVETTAFSVNVYTGVVTLDVAPGAGVTITAGYEFYVPVRFTEETSERFGVSLIGQDTSEVSVSMVEVPGEGAYSTDFAYGGHLDGSSMNSDIRLSGGDGGLIELVPQRAGLRVFLPDVKNIGEGVGHMWITNASLSFTVDLLPFTGGAVLTTIPVATGAGPSVVVLGMKDVGASKVWAALR